MLVASINMTKTMAMQLQVSIRTRESSADMKRLHMQEWCQGS